MFKYLDRTAAFSMEKKIHINFLDEFVRSLHHAVYRITFTKTNGEERVMICTRNAEKLKFYLGDNFSLEKNQNEINDEVKWRDSNPRIPVFDIEEQEWRSFKYGSIKKIELEMPIDEDNTIT